MNAVDLKTLTLVKDGRKYIFRYAPGCEARVVEEIMRMAQDKQTNLNWADAAALSYQIIQNSGKAAATGRAKVTRANAKSATLRRPRPAWRAA